MLQRDAGQLHACGNISTSVFDKIVTSQGDYELQFEITDNYNFLISAVCEPYVYLQITCNDRTVLHVAVFITSITEDKTCTMVLNLDCRF